MKRDAATQAQVDAANPKMSTWLSANAGSGKTRVLTDRVARLLLEDVSPQNILCLTYTKAAATEMQNRLFQRLGDWAMMSDGDLRMALDNLGFARAIGQEELRYARTLFARAIETPGGLKIQTIHSFCAGILRRFPLEAKVSPQFREIEERAAELLRAEVADGMLLGADAPIVKAMLAQFTGDDVAALTAEIVKNREAFLGPFDQEKMRQQLGITPTDSVADFVSEVFDPTLLRAIADACIGGGSTDSKLAKGIYRLLGGTPRPHDLLSQLEGMFLTGKTASAPFTAKIGKTPTKSIRTAHPALAAQTDELMARIEDIRPHRLGLMTYERTKALYDFATRFIPAYEARKLAMGALDFDDLIDKAKALLTDRDVAAWVLFRLDGGIDHVLVDEAQDTSPSQWAVIERLTQEFAAGEGADPERERTVFVVGDKKQSIYSFQGADPAAFDKMKAHFADAQKAIGKNLISATLAHSFRSSQAILSVVDACFTGDRAAGMDDSLTHIAFQENMPGRVDLWPVIEKDDSKPAREWYRPVDEPSATDHTVLMAERVASQIKHMIAHERLPELDRQTGTYKSRAITEGDILILVQRRSELFAEIIRACKAADLKIAGADRLRVGAELAVKDLAALLKFLALPEDDLSLAAALRSPLFGWSEQALYTLAHHRPKDSYLWQALRDMPETDTLAVLNDLRDKADFLRPYDLLERILIGHGGRQKLLARLGPEAEDGIDALLAQALAYESARVPSLTGFLSWMETDDVEIKRQMESKGDRIRVMTVHGAKGLEAPIVFLPDAAKRDIRLRQEILPAQDQVIWRPLADNMPDAVAAMRAEVIEKQRQERLRLLYVAMTRAEKWLIVGAAGEIGQGDESWYNIVADGMAQRGIADAAIGDLQVKRVAVHQWDGLDQIELHAEPDIDVTVPVFANVAMPERVATISPSDLGGAKVLAGDPSEADSDAAKARGTLIHRLLEHLPKVAKEERTALASQIAGDDDEATKVVVRLLDNQALGWIWSDAALTEVDLTADVPGLGRIHGAIDRLVVTESKVTAIDYKSNRLVPAAPAETPLGLIRQMAVYQAALSRIYPDHLVEVAILWTETGQLMPLPEEMLHEALKTISTP